MVLAASIAIRRQLSVDGQYKRDALASDRVTRLAALSITLTIRESHRRVVNGKRHAGAEAGMPFVNRKHQASRVHSKKSATTSFLL